MEAAPTEAVAAWRNAEAKAEIYITPAPGRMPLCRGHKIHDSIADIETRNPQRQPRRALGQLRSTS